MIIVTGIGQLGKVHKPARDRANTGVLAKGTHGLYTASGYLRMVDNCRSPCDSWTIKMIRGAKTWEED
jgi:hypothetical protein